MKIISFSDFEDLGLGFGRKIIRDIGFLTRGGGIVGVEDKTKRKN